MNLLVETNAYASGSGVVTGFTKKEIRLVPLAPALENRICLLFPKIGNQSNWSLLYQRIKSVV